MRHMKTSAGRIFLPLSFFCLLLFLLSIYTSTSTSTFKVRKVHVATEYSDDSSVRRASSVNFTEYPDSDIMLKCLSVVLRGQLPLARREIDMGGRFGMGIENLQVAFPHHLIAETGLWNQDLRLKPIPYMHSVKKCSIWEVGAHTEAADSRQFMASYPHCRFHAYEPIPLYANTLKRNWASDKRLVIHEYGIGSNSMQLQISENRIRGQGTDISSEEISENHHNGLLVNLTIKSFSEAEVEADGLPTLLHLNCEGCEYDLLKQAATSWSLAKIPVIQIGWHNYGDLGLRVWQTCEIREQLSKTHQLTAGAAFGWDRWLRRDIHEIGLLLVPLK